MEYTMKKCALLLVLFFGLIFSLAAASSRDTAKEQKPVPLVINAIKGPSGVGMIRLFENPPQIPGYDVSVKAVGQADIAAAAFIAGEAAVSVLPVNVAAKIASQAKNLQVAAIVGNGMLSLITSDKSVNSIAALKGKTVEVAGRGATPEYVFRRILAANGLNPDTDLAMTFTLAYPEIAQSLIAGRIATALLPEPFATMALMGGNGTLRAVGSIEDEWIKAGGKANFPMSALVVNSDFAKANRNAVDRVVTEIKASTEWVVANPALAGQLVEQFELGLKAAVVEAAVPRSNYVFIPAVEARPAIEALLSIFLENDPASIGGALPGENFYY
jgi:NitT/TauT family transport system substrate-binding protein